MESVINYAYDIAGKRDVKNVTTRCKSVAIIRPRR